MKVSWWFCWRVVTKIGNENGKENNDGYSNFIDSYNN